VNAAAAPIPLSPNGPRLSPIVAGVWRIRDWNFDVPARLRWIEQALDLGITSFDNADIYGDYQAETLFGEALAAAPALRRRMQLVTKCGIKLLSAQRPAHRVKSYDSSHAHVIASVENSLRALRTDQIDLLLLHRPDFLMDADQLAHTLHVLIEAGKVLHVGVSNYTPSQFALLNQRIPLATNQIELSPLALGVLGDGTLDQCQALGCRPMAWSPLAGGRLFRDNDERTRRVRGVLGELAAAYGVGAATIAYAWIRRHPARPVPITGSGRGEALREAVAALSIDLSGDDWYRVWQASVGHEVA
jgi:predicted oxidoreductase